MTPFRSGQVGIDLAHVRIFGYKAMVHVPKIQKQKLDKKAKNLILVGYPYNVKGYKLYNPKTRKITMSRDVIIIEKENSSSAQIVVNNEDDKEKKSDKDENSEIEESLTINNSVNSTYKF
ncbi:Retrovirus-related Pol polyprotein from transposon TNT 1-94 [Eumeta japonica]|uniref:Retrovirus-related Pol polyprotein from transposon TNT 1-94 n=1 Tax=Eumeta variegata TaxID=151549 RepID=A0A4C1ZSZ2_EUMVA|nr:Retrovirus-related Pol polyprotein from transposon TNT 1-94 [Eumeta japonica]